MSVALCALSHTPLMGKVDPQPEVVAAVDDALRAARDFVTDYAPDLVVAFAPDHYNGFLYEVMPQFCVGTSAESIGDFGLPSGPLNVATDTARAVARSALDADIDVAYSERMLVDHGLVQPLVQLFGDLQRVSVVPVFVNCAAAPLAPARRSVALGRAVGELLRSESRRVLILASGGLSHDPPVPRLAEASPEVAQRITIRHEVTAQERHERESRTTAAARAFAAGDDRFHDLNPEWDQLFLDACASGDLAPIADHPNAWFADKAGHSAHEVRTWLAAYAALGACGEYTVTSRFYTPVREWFAGYAITTARLDSKAESA